MKGGVAVRVGFTTFRRRHRGRRVMSLLLGPRWEATTSLMWTFSGAACFGLLYHFYRPFAT